MRSLWIAIQFAAIISAQSLQITPTNDSVPSISGDAGLQLQLRTSQTGMVQMTQVVPLTTAAGLGGSLSYLQVLAWMNTFNYC